MFHLPIEVFELIFSLITIRDKLECMTVCRQWHHIIYNHNLFQVIAFDNQFQLEKLIEVVKKDPALGKKVEILKLKLHYCLGLDGSTFVELFPNVRQFFFDINRDSRDLDSLQDHPWRERAEKMTEVSTSVNTMLLLHYGPCKNLTSISVNGSYGSMGIDYAPLRHLCTVLANAPNLKFLDLSHYHIALQDLEYLHSVLPCLESLSTMRTFISCSFFPQDIKPATSMKSFRTGSTDAGSNHDYNQYSLYLSQKYTKLEEFKLEIFTDRTADEDWAVTAAVRKETNASHLRTLVPYLKRLAIDLLRDNESLSDRFDFGLMDQCWCQLTRLDLDSAFDVHLLERLASTVQAKHIQSLSVAGTISKSLPLEWIRSFAVLNDLSLSLTYTYSVSSWNYEICPLNLTNLLDVLSGVQLESLQLSQIKLYFDDKKSASSVYPSLKILSFADSKFEENMDVHLSHSFPNVKRLKMNRCTWKGSSLMLPNLNLSYLEIMNRSMDGDYYVLLITLDNNQRRLYTASKESSFFRSNLYDTENDISDHPYIPSKPYDNSPDVPNLTIVCKSVWEFIILH